jgi:hypothetical protein
MAITHSPTVCALCAPAALAAGWRWCTALHKGMAHSAAKHNRVHIYVVSEGFSLSGIKVHQRLLMN